MKDFVRFINFRYTLWEDEQFYYISDAIHDPISSFFMLFLNSLLLRRVYCIPKDSEMAQQINSTSKLRTLYTLFWKCLELVVSIGVVGLLLLAIFVIGKTTSNYDLDFFRSFIEGAVLDAAALALFLSIVSNWILKFTVQIRIKNRLKGQRQASYKLVDVYNPGSFGPKLAFIACTVIWYSLLFYLIYKTISGASRNFAAVTILLLTGWFLGQVVSRRSRSTKLQLKETMTSKRPENGVVDNVMESDGMPSIEQQVAWHNKTEMDYLKFAYWINIVAGTVLIVCSMIGTLFWPFIEGVSVLVVGIFMRIHTKRKDWSHSIFVSYIFLTFFLVSIFVLF